MHKYTSILFIVLMMVIISTPAVSPASDAADIALDSKVSCHKSEPSGMVMGESCPDCAAARCMMGKTVANLCEPIPFASIKNGSNTIDLTNIVYTNPFLVLAAPPPKPFA